MKTYASIFDRSRELHYGNIFNPRTLNIFTDASIKRTPTETIGCPGAVVVMTDDNGSNIITDINSYIVRNSTSNESEILAIQLGVAYAINYKDMYDTVNLFSDSNICIQGLTNWIFSWRNNIRNNTLYSSTGNKVSNQEIFMNIIYMINYSNLNINFYHQKGHVNTNSGVSLNKAMKSMMKTNSFSYLDISLVHELSNYNDIIDIYTKKHLNEFVKSYGKAPEEIFSQSLRYDQVDFDKYRNLIKN